MIVNDEDVGFQKFDDEKAFKHLLSELFNDCMEKFSLKVGKKSGWASELDDGLTEILIAGIERHFSLLKTGEYALDDLVDIVNLVAMLYNLKGE